MMHAANLPEQTPEQPYPGLRPFRRDESDLFFGRDGCVDEMMARLRATRFLAVLGSSGTGKSSLVRAGLLPALETGRFSEGAARWRIVVFTPGDDPLGRFAEAMLGSGSDSTDAKRPSELEIANLKDEFKLEGPRALIKWCHEGNLESGTNLLILVDQFEELFSYRNNAEREAAQSFVSLLLESRWPRGVDSPEHAPLPIYIAIAMRSEYLGAAALMLGLAEAINKGTYLTPRMTRDQCHEAIVGPALLCGVDLEDRLVTRLLNDMADFAPWEERADATDEMTKLARQADQLPLMQYALNRMWRRAKAKAKTEHGANETIQLKLDDYLGLERELDKSGEDVFEDLRATDRRTASFEGSLQRICETVFRALTKGTTLGDATRRPTKFDDLIALCGKGSDEAVHEVMRRFSSDDCQFLVPAASKDRQIDISHESLIRQWQRLSKWVVDEGETARRWRNYSETARDFVAGHRSRISRLFAKKDLLVGWQLSVWKSNALNLLLRRYKCPPLLRSVPGRLLPMRYVKRQFFRRGDNAALRWAQRYGGDAKSIKTLLGWSLIRRAEKRVLVYVVICAVSGVVVAYTLEAKRRQNETNRMLEAAESIVFKLGNNPRVKSLPPEVRKQIFEQAINIYNGLAADDRTANAYNGLGAAYAAELDYNDAISAYDEAIALDPGFRWAYENRGHAYYRKKEYSNAISSYEKAIAIYSKDATYYIALGDAHRHNGDFNEAIVDYQQAINIESRHADAYDGLAMAYFAKGDPSDTIASYDQATAIDSTDSWAYVARGVADLYAGLPALADLQQAENLDPTYAYTALWIDIADKRGHLPSQLPAVVAKAQIDMTEWPGALIRLYLGQLTPEKAREAADDGAERICEANFYTAELKLDQGARDDALKLFRLAAAGCPKGFLEWAAANAELKALGEPTR
jgi:lipoprotein NlpI